MTHFAHIQQKITDRKTLAQRIRVWQQSGLNVVFTNGCFDVLHYGHLHYLAAAAELGDRLVIGLNSADSVRRLKGPTRPINDEMTRQTTLAALSFVDAVCPFEEDTPLELLRTLRPDFLVKGGDYEAEKVVGYELLRELGGEVVILPFVEGYSTTNLEQIVLQRHGFRD